MILYHIFFFIICQDFVIIINIIYNYYILLHLGGTMYIDTHAHLDLILDQELFFHLSKKNAIPYQLSDIISKELEFVNHISLDPDNFLQHYPLFKDNQKIYFSTGIYPDRTTFSHYNEKEYLSKLKSILKEYPHIALGEAGIDYHDDRYGSKEAQESLFRHQVELADELNLPLIIHSRNTFDDCFCILKNYPKVHAIWHCFHYGINEMELILSRNDHISFSGLLTHKKNISIQDAAKIIPLNRVLFETDSPYLSPTPVRGTCNIPTNTKYIYQYFAQLRDINLQELIPIIRENVKNAFPIIK